ncbi:MAG: hypothetical protein IKR05_00200 [Prevotella sp.]|nr:hypothetical protein [Prevotella sp.]
MFFYSIRCDTDRLLRHIMQNPAKYVAFRSFTTHRTTGGTVERGLRLRLRLRLSLSTGNQRESCGGTAAYGEEER